MVSRVSIILRPPPPPVSLLTLLSDVGLIPTALLPVSPCSERGRHSWRQSEVQLSAFASCTWGLFLLSQGLRSEASVCLTRHQHSIRGMYAWNRIRVSSRILYIKCAHRQLCFSSSFNSTKPTCDTLYIASFSVDMFQVHWALKIIATYT